MSFTVVLLYLSTLLFLASIAKLYWSWKKSVSGIALGTAMMVVTILVMMQFAIKIDVFRFVLEIATGSDPINALEKSKPSTLVSIVNGVVCFIAAIVVSLLGFFGIKNYKGPVKSSELDARNRDDKNAGFYIGRLIISDIKYLTKPNAIVYKEGRNPYQIVPLSKPKPWNEIALDLLRASNKDISPKIQEWSDSYKCYILEKNDFIKKTTNQIFFFPLLGNCVTQELLNTIDSIDPNIPADSELILCFEDETDEPINQKTTSGRVYSVTDKVRLVEKSTDLTSYAKSILRRFQKDIVLRYPHENSTSLSSWNELTLADTYTKLRVTPYQTETDSHGEPIEIQELINSWLDHKASPQLSILGQFGQGKSTAMLHFAADWAKRYLESVSKGEERRNRERVPLLIELRGRSPKDQPTGIGILGEWGHQYGLSGELLNNLVNSEMAILIFEGFDEVKNAGKKLDRYEHFNSLWKFAFEGSKIIFTGRPNFFLDDEERIQFLNSTSDVLSNGSCISSAYSIEFMTIEDINTTLRLVRSDLRDEIISHSTNDPLLMDIAKRPSMLPVVVSQWNKIKLAQERGEKITSSQIVRSYIEATYKRKNEEAINRGEYQLLPWEIRHFITQAVCLDMISRNDKNTTTPDNMDSAVKKIEQYFNFVYLSEESPPHLVEAITKLNHVKNSDDKPYDDYIKEISSDVRSNGLLASDPATGTDSLYFPHKQFYEYILGETYASFFIRPKSKAATALSKFQGRAHKNLLIAYYREPMIIQYFSGLFTAKDICKLTPGIDSRSFGKLAKPIYMIVSRFYQMLISEMGQVYEILEGEGKGSLKNSVIATNRMLESMVKNPRFLVGLLALYVLSPLYLFFGFVGASVDRNAKVKYALMRYRCEHEDIESIFVFEGSRLYLESAYNRMYQDKND